MPPSNAHHEIKCISHCPSTAGLDSVWIYPVFGVLIAVIWLVGRILWRRLKAANARN